MRPPTDQDYWRDRLLGEIDDAVHEDSEWGDFVRRVVATTPPPEPPQFPDTEVTPGQPAIYPVTGQTGRWLGIQFREVYLSVGSLMRIELCLPDGRVLYTETLRHSGGRTGGHVSVCAPDLPPLTAEERVGLFWRCSVEDVAETKEAAPTPEG